MPRRMSFCTEAVASLSVKGISSNPVREGVRSAHFGRQAPARSTGQYFLKEFRRRAQRMCPVVFSEMRLFAAATEDVLATYFVGVRVSERRQSEERYGQGAALWHPGGACPKTKHAPEILICF